MKTALQLELTRHELFVVAPHTPVTGPAVRVEVTPEDRPAFFAIARLVICTNQNDGDYYRVFFRDEGRPHDEIFSISKTFEPGKERPSSEELMQRAVREINSGYATRYWQPPDLPYCLQLRSYGIGQIIEKPGQYVSCADFWWGKWESDEESYEGETKFRVWNTHDFHNVCRQLVDNPDSELNFLLNWQKLPADEKTAFATRCEVGDWNELLQLFTWVLRLMTHHFGPYDDVKMQRSVWDFPRPISPNFVRPVAFFARRWRETLCSIVRPTFWLGTPLCLHQWRQTESGVKNHVECEIPTMHEFLEAQLQFRDFLRPHLPEAEIEALLTP